MNWRTRFYIGLSVAAAAAYGFLASEPDKEEPKQQKLERTDVFTFFLQNSKGISFNLNDSGWDPDSALDKTKKMCEELVNPRFKHDCGLE